jgi:tetratricopeptide (TPR) repeat protein
VHVESAHTPDRGAWALVPARARRWSAILAGLLLAFPALAHTADGPSSDSAPLTTIRKSVVVHPSHPWQQAAQVPLPWVTSFRLHYPLWRIPMGPATAQPVPVEHQAVIMENDHLRVVVLPAYAGRVFRVITKADGRDLLYVNPSFKPNPYGPRRAWVATGGLEFNAHDLQPWTASWEVTAEGGIVHLTGVERPGGLRMSVDVELGHASAALTVRTRLLNPSSQPAVNGYMANYMFTMRPGTEMILPARRVVSHGGSATFSYGGDLPDKGFALPWPIYRGRDFRFGRTWKDTFGLYQTDITDPFVGVYQPDEHTGFARVYDPSALPGLELFTFGSRPRFTLYRKPRYTDGGELYGEIMCHTTTLPREQRPPQIGPEAMIRWSERLVPLTNLGGLTWADEQIALHLDGGDDRGGQGRLALLSAEPVERLNVRLQSPDGSWSWQHTFQPAVGSTCSAPVRPPADVKQLTMEVVGHPGGDLRRRLERVHGAWLPAKREDQGPPARAGLREGEAATASRYERIRRCIRVGQLGRAGRLLPDPDDPAVTWREAFLATAWAVEFGSSAEHRAWLDRLGQFLPGSLSVRALRSPESPLPGTGADGASANWCVPSFLNDDMPYFALAEDLSATGLTRHSPALRSLARRASAEALRRQDDNAMAHVLAFLLAGADADRDAAEQVLARLEAANRRRLIVFGDHPLHWCRQALAQAPDSPVLHHLAGTAQLVAGQVAPAIVSLEHSLQLDEGNPVTRTYLAAALRRADRRDQAVRAARRALDEAQGHPDTLWLLADTLARGGNEDKAEAVELYRRLLDRQPWNIDAIHSLGWTYHHLERTEQAIATFRTLEGTRHPPDGPVGWARMRKADRLARQDKWDQALAIYDDMTRQFPTILALHRQYLRLANRAGRDDVALEIHGRVADLYATYGPDVAGNNPWGMTHIVESCEQAGRDDLLHQAREDLVDYLQHRLDRQPTWLDGYVRLAETYIALDEPDQALKSVRRLLATSPDHEEGRRLLDKLTGQSRRVR